MMRIPISNEQFLEGELSIPENALGIVLFAHGSGSSRFSPRNQAVARFLRQQQLGTVLIDLLTPGEEKIDLITREYRFDIDRLSARLSAIIDWLKNQVETKRFPIGLFGSSTGAAGALIAAAKKRKEVAAVVSRGGRPDLAGDYLQQVHAPTLLIVGGSDTVVIELNQQAYELLTCERKIEIIPHATHLFEEPGALDEVSRLTALWFRQYFPLSK